MKKRILFLTSNIGGGHMSAAKAISEALDHYYPGEYEHEFVDVLTLLGPSLDKLIAKMHGFSVSYAKISYKAFFELTDRSNIVKYFDNYGYHLIKQRFKSLVDSSPDIIISSFPFLTYSVSRYLRTIDSKGIKLISVITDTGEVHSAWISKHVDYYVVPTIETGFHLLNKEIPKEKILNFGLPLRREFYNRYDENITRKEFGISGDQKIILYLMGAWGTGTKTIDKLLEIDDTNNDICLVVVCGRNKRLQNKISKYKFKNRVIALDYVNNISELIASADIVVTKAGGASIMEAIKYKKPIIISEVLPGQERPNAKFIESMGFGYVETNPITIASRIRYLLSTEDIERIKNNYKNYTVGESSDKNIADFIDLILK